MLLLTKERVLEALQHVEDPDLKKDLVTLGMVEDIQIEGNKLSFTIVLTTPACPLKSVIENACRNAISHFISPEIEVSIKMSSRVASSTNSIEGIKNIILVSSGKGGVGKSTVSANLAISLANKGAKVGLIDADIYGPSQPTMFNLVNAKPLSVEVNGKTKMQPIEKYGVKILSLGFFAEPNQAVPWRGPMASNAVKQLFNDAAWGDLDYLVVDLPPGTGDIHITVTQSFPIAGAIVVTTPQKVATMDTRKGIGMFRMQGVTVPLLGIVENMAFFTPDELPEKKYYLFGKGGGLALSQEFDIPFLGELPILEQICESGDEGLPIAMRGETLAAKAFEQLAEKVAQQLAVVNAQKA